MHFQQELTAYLTKLSDASPVPNGGTVCALSGAQAAALLCFVCNLTKDKKKYAEHREEILGMLKTCQAIQKNFMQLGHQDQIAFEELINSEKSHTPNDFNHYQCPDSKAKKACEPPMAMMRDALKLLPLALRLFDIGNPNLISDVGIAVFLSMTALRGAKLNVMINLQNIKDREFYQSMMEESATILQQAETLSADALNLISDRMSANSANNNEY